MSIRIISPQDTDTAVEILRAGGLVGLPTETVYGLAAIATNEDAVRRIYEVKGRPLDHPVIVHIGSIAELDEWADEVSDATRTLVANFWPGPLTIVVKRKAIAKDWLTGGQNTVALRMPANQIALEILQKLGTGVAAPSANKFGSVSPTSPHHVIADLAESLDENRDAIIDGGSCQVGIESTIVNCTIDHPKVLRPGAITQEQIDQALGSTSEVKQTQEIKAPGLLASHYAPKAKVILVDNVQNLDSVLEQLPTDTFIGLIALEKIQTPKGCIRLAMPQDNQTYAQVLYEALREGDNQKCKHIVAVMPSGDDIAVAIRDRLTKAAF